MHTDRREVIARLSAAREQGSPAAFISGCDSSLRTTGTAIKKQPTKISRIW
jgi:hypothetical protein